MHHAFHFDETFWVAFAFVLLIALIFRPLKNLFAQALSARATAIQTQLAEAKRLRNEASALLAEFKVKQAEAEKLTAEIMTNAETTVHTMQAEAERSLTELAEKRTSQLLARIATYEATVLTELRTQATEIAFQAVRILLHDHIKDELSADQLKYLVKDVNKRLN
jgi:F-type H+-transporting ATPase subunit b